MKRPGAVEVGCRVVIRVPTARDRDEFLVLMRSSHRSLRPWVEPPADRAAFAAYLKRTRRPTERGFFVCRREDGVIAGVINVSQIFHGAFQSAYLGFYAGPSFMGKGYMSEGLRLVLRHAFLELQPGNRASIRLVRRAGFRREGLSPRYLKVFGRWRDHERWAITVENLRR